MNEHTLPDSRAKNPTGTVVANLELDEIHPVNGILQVVRRKYRLEMERIYCWNCGRTKGWVPRGIFSWVSFLCDPCSDSVGAAAALLPANDAEFWAKVGEEMHRSYGRVLTQQELWELAERGELSRGLQLLERESPYKSERK